MENPSATTPESKPPAWFSHSPEVLQLPEDHGRFTAAILGAVLGVGATLCFYIIAPKESTVAKLFDPHSPQIIAPIIILATFFWGVWLCYQRRQRILAVEATSKPTLVTEAGKFLVDQKLAALAHRLTHAQAEVSPMLKRIKAIVTQWQMKPGIVEADLILQQFVSDDQDATRRAFSLVRTFIWGLPVLGLIGTVLGIAIAVSGFSGLLGNQMDDVEQIKTNLIGVTGGLSFAFLLTLMGLATSLILMLIASSLETREERLYQEIQQNVVNRFLPVLQSTCPERASGDHDVLARFAEAALMQIAKVSDTCLANLAGQLQDWQVQVETWGKDLHTQAAIIANEMVRASQTAAELHRDQTATNKVVVAELQKAAKDYTTVLTVHSTDIVKAMQEVAVGTRQSAEIQKQVHQAVQQLNDAKLVATLQSFQEALTRHANLVDKLNTGLKIVIS